MQNVFFFFLEMHAVSDGIISEDQIRSQKFSVTLQTLYDKAKKTATRHFHNMSIDQFCGIRITILKQMRI